MSKTPQTLKKRHYLHSKRRTRLTPLHSVISQKNRTINMNAV